MRFHEENYIKIHGFMITKLNIKDTQLILYALIYGFCEGKNSSFSASLKYMCEATNKTKPSIIKALKALVEKNLIKKEEVGENGVKFCIYKINYEETSHASKY